MMHAMIELSITEQKWQGSLMAQPNYSARIVCLVIVTDDLAKAVVISLPAIYIMMGCYERLVSLLIIDIDHFKHINDTLGDDGSDNVLHAISSLIMANIRQTDRAGFWGGDLFIICFGGGELRYTARPFYQCSR